MMSGEQLYGHRSHIKGGGEGIFVGHIIGSKEGRSLLLRGIDLLFISCYQKKLCRTVNNTVYSWEKIFCVNVETIIIRKKFHIISFPVSEMTPGGGLILPIAALPL